MLTYIIKRISMTNHMTYGVMLDENNIPFVVTLEKPWINNQKNISCIPKGIYTCNRVITPLHGNCFQVMGVAGRDAILLHKGNIEDDSKGCILIGESFSYNIKNGESGIASSAQGYEEFMKKLAGQNSFTLKIIEV